GKSTLVNAIFSTLFLTSNLRKRSADWNNYIEKYMPYPHGDTIQVFLSFKGEGGKEYILLRSWGEEKKDRLVLPDKSEINHTEKIQKELNSFLRYGRGTYEGVLFARQEEMIRTLDMLKQNSEAVNNVSHILRSVVFQAGGVSVEELAAEIEVEKNDLLKLWDVERDGPKGNRGVNNPYQKGLGRIIAAYYEIEGLKQLIKETINVEKQVLALTSKLQESFREKEEIIDPRKSQMEKIEGDIQKRAALEPTLSLIKEKEKVLKDINLRWPRTEERLKNLQKEFNEKEKRKTELQKELQEAGEIITARKKRELYRKIKPLVLKYNENKNELNSLPVVTPSEVKRLENLQNQITRFKATIEAMKLKGRMSSTLPMEITITSGLNTGKPIKVEGESEFAAEGRVVIESRDWTLEIQSGQEDVSKIISDIDKAQGFFAEKLQARGVQTLNEAGTVVEKRGELERSMKLLHTKIEALLGELSFTELEKQVSHLVEDKPVRDPETIKSELSDLVIAINRVKVDADNSAEQIKTWEEEYGRFDRVMDALVDLRGEAGDVLKEMKELAPLPDQYETPEEFMESLKKVRSRSDGLKEGIYNLKIELNEAQNNLPEDSAEELQEKLKLGEKKLKSFKDRARALEIIESEFKKLVEEADKKTFDPLVKSFTRYLSPLTNYRYKSAQMDGTIPSSVAAAECEGGLPVELLSTGTVRGVALALRLAMAEHLLMESDGFIIMDDPLVDLDPDRKEHAAGILKEFASTKQLIITTCDPVTAKLLGGRIINLAE
ncbi:MAG: hypothetical protein CVU88_01515, partial [Firmicutes bacterium HGW-Firmicutes-13]